MLDIPYFIHLIHSLRSIPRVASINIESVVYLYCKLGACIARTTFLYGCSKKKHIRPSTSAAFALTTTVVVLHGCKGIFAILGRWFSQILKSHGIGTISYHGHAKINQRGSFLMIVIIPKSPLEWSVANVHILPVLTFYGRPFSFRVFVGVQNGSGCRGRGGAVGGYFFRGWF